MIKLYDKLKTIAESEYKDIVNSTKILGKQTIGTIMPLISLILKLILNISMTAMKKASNQVI